MQLFFDESGFTGEDMMNPAQPVFSLASHNVPEVDAKELVADHFANFQGDELKYSVLRGSARGRRNLLSLFKALHKSDYEIMSYVVDKRFSACTKIFDIFTETRLFDEGKNVYAGYQNIVTVNRVYGTLMAKLGAAKTNALMMQFQLMMRKKSEANYNAFWNALTAERDASDGILRQAIEVLLYGSAMPLAEYFEIPDKSIDLSFSTFLAQVVGWQAARAEKFEIIHDASTNTQGNAITFEALSDPALEKELLGQGDSRDIEVPLRVGSLNFYSSKDFAGIQIADCLAGAFNEVTRNHIGVACNEAFVKELVKVGMGNVTNNMLHNPQYEPPGVSKGTNGVDPHLRFAEILARN